MMSNAKKVLKKCRMHQHKRFTNLTKKAGILAATRKPTTLPIMRATHNHKGYQIVAGRKDPRQFFLFS